MIIIIIIIIIVVVEKKHIIKRWQNICDILMTSFGC